MEQLNKLFINFGLNNNLINFIVNNPEVVRKTIKDWKRQLSGFTNRFFIKNEKFFLRSTSAKDIYLEDFLKEFQEEVDLKIETDIVELFGNIKRNKRRRKTFFSIYSLNIKSSLEIICRNSGRLSLFRDFSIFDSLDIIKTLSEAELISGQEIIIMLKERTEIENSSPSKYYFWFLKIANNSIYIKKRYKLETYESGTGFVF